MRFPRMPWSKKPVKKGQQVILNAVSSTGPITCHGHQEVVSWLAGKSSPDALASVIAQQERSLKRDVRKIAPPARGTEAVNGWLVSPSQMCLEEIIEVRDRASTDAASGSRRDSMDLTFVNSPRASMSSQRSWGSEVRSYLLGISTAAEASLEASPEVWDVEDEDSAPSSPAETVDGKYLALMLGDGPVDAFSSSSSKTRVEYPTEDGNGNDNDDGYENDDNYEDDIPWASDEVRSSIGDILPLASASPRKAIVVDRPSATPMEDEQVNLPVCVGQPMRPQQITIRVSSGTSSFTPYSPDEADAEYQAQDYYTLPVHPALRDLHFGFQTPDSWDDGWTEPQELPIPVKVTPPSPPPPVPEPPVSQPPTAQQKGKYLAVPNTSTLELLIDVGSVIDYYLELNQDDDSDSDSDSGRDSVGNFNYEAEKSNDDDDEDDDDDETYHLLSRAAVLHLDAIKKHLSLPVGTTPQELQLYLSRNVEIIRATVLGIVCNPRLLDSHDQEVSISPGRKENHRAFVDAICMLEWNPALSRGGLVPTVLSALADEETFVTRRMRKRTAKHLVRERDMSWSQVTRFLQVADFHDDLADQDRLVRSGRVEEFIDLVGKGVIGNENGIFTFRGGIKHIMGLKKPRTGMDRIRWKQKRGFQSSPLGRVTNMSDLEADEDEGSMADEQESSKVDDEDSDDGDEKDGAS